MVATLIEGLAAFWAGDGARAEAPLARAVAGAGETDDVFVLMHAGWAAGYLGDDATAYDLLHRAVQAARNSGAVGSLASPLQYSARAELCTGRLNDCAASATEGLKVALETGEGAAANYRALMATVEAIRGQEESCHVLAAQARAVARPRGLALVASTADVALGLLDLGLGRADEAYERLRAVVTDTQSHPMYRLLVIPDLIEAAARARHGEVVKRELTAFERWAKTGSLGESAVAARSRALVGDPGHVP